jgi:hypothetical protein
MPRRSTIFGSPTVQYFTLSAPKDLKYRVCQSVLAEDGRRLSYERFEHRPSHPVNLYAFLSNIEVNGQWKLELT